MNKFDYKGQSEDLLRNLCAEESLDIESPWKYWTAEIYSFGRHIRSYAFYPKFLPLYCYTDHGISNNYIDIPPHELENDSPLQFYHSPKNIAKFKNKSPKPCYGLYSPFVWYRRNNRITRMPSAKGTLAFVPHSTPSIDVVYDLKKHIKMLQNLPQKFHPVCACMHMHDVNKGAYKVFLEAGMPVYTAGNVSDPRFAERWYNIVKHFSFTTSDAVGSHGYYSVEMGIPFFLYGEHASYWNYADPNLALGEYRPRGDEEFEKLEASFRGIDPVITDWQRMSVEKALGLYDGISRIKMAGVLYRAYFVKEGIFRGLFYMIKSLRKNLKFKVA